jgi:hypothetical protein
MRKTPQENYFQMAVAILEFGLGTSPSHGTNPSSHMVDMDALEFSLPDILYLMHLRVTVWPLDAHIRKVGIAPVVIPFASFEASRLPPLLRLIYALHLAHWDQFGPFGCSNSERQSCKKRSSTVMMGYDFSWG